MRAVNRSALSLMVLSLSVLPSIAQAPSTAPAPSAVAATVNGQAIPEAAVKRGLSKVQEARLAECRKEQLDFLINNALVDQYLTQLKVQVDAKEVDARLEQIRTEIKQQGQTMEKVLQDLGLTEAELRIQMEADQRWEKFVSQQATEAKLREFVENNRETFDGTQVRRVIFC